MDAIKQLCNEIDNSESIEHNIELVKRLNEIIENEKDYLNLQLNNLNTVDLNTFKIPVKYKKLTIEELEEQLKLTENIDTMCSIYNSISKKLL
jgi:hypothetical protein